MQFNKNAWDILTPHEQMALNLQHIHNKSSWQAGEVLEKAHYKYLEIKYRAETFFKMFTTHFQIYDHLVPDLKIKPEIKAYLEKTIAKRILPREAQIEVFKEFTGLNKKTLTEMLISFISRNEESRDLEMENFISLVKEFDRWNSHRILPLEVQEPSAYKRRNKNVYKKQIKLILAIPPLAIDVLKKTCLCRNTTGLYIVLKEEKITILNVRPKLYNKLTELGFYIFEDKEKAKIYGGLLEKYISIENKTCKDGLNFWPEFRQSMKYAKNYDQVNNIKPNRRYLLMAMKNTEFYNYKK